MTPSIRLTAPVLGTPDPPGLARFYQRLLGWPMRDDEPEWATLRPADGSTGLSFQLEADHVPPVWPQEGDVQQMQIHLDFEVDDLDAASALAEDAGARLLGPASLQGPAPSVRSVGGREVLSLFVPIPAA